MKQPKKIIELEKNEKNDGQKDYQANDKTKN